MVEHSTAEVYASQQKLHKLRLSWICSHAHVFPSIVGPCITQIYSHVPPPSSSQSCKFFPLECSLFLLPQSCQPSCPQPRSKRRSMCIRRKSLTNSLWIPVKNKSFAGHKHVSMTCCMTQPQKIRARYLVTFRSHPNFLIIKRLCNCPLNYVIVLCEGKDLITPRAVVGFPPQPLYACMFIIPAICLAYMFFLLCESPSLDSTPSSYYLFLETSSNLFFAFSVASHFSNSSLKTHLRFFFARPP